MSPKLVRDLMHIGVTTCPANTSLADATRILLNQNLETLIVLNGNGHAIGVFGREEAVAAYARTGTGLREDITRTVADAMRTEIPTIPPDIPAAAAAQLMLDHGVRDIYLMHRDGGIGWPAAVLRFRDVLRYLAARSDDEIADMGAGATRKSPLDLFKERHKKAT
ncbi:MAG: cyclic nucleotide-binding/CBS domain-containing protein [Anaerolineae bacterium]